VTRTNNFASALGVHGPEQARTLATELEAALEGTGTHAMLKMTSALAATAVLRERALFRHLADYVDDRGYPEVRARALELAAAFARPSDAARDPITRLVTAALERGLRMAPSTRSEHVDPLLHACTDIVEIMNALSIWRLAMDAAEDLSESIVAAELSAPSSDGRRRLTRDFEVTPPGSVPSRAEPPRSGERAPVQPRSTMRPSPTRSTLGPSPVSQSDLDKDAVLVPRTQVRDAQGRPLKKKW
jgi:hypothetical protein